MIKPDKESQMAYKNLLNIGRRISDNNHYHKTKTRHLIQNRKYQQKLRLEVLIHYSSDQPRCACCGETIYEFLSIDHINNDGNIQRRIGLVGYKLLVWLKKNKYPKGFQVLCMNCNFGKKINNGVCPHVKQK